MKGLNLLNPMILDPDKAIKCDLLCNLQCSYSHGDIQYIFNKSGNVYFKYVGKNTVDVQYNNIPYSLQKIYISERRHRSHPVDNTIVGECCFFHKGANDNLVISIFLRTTRGFSQSQDFFSQFLNVSVGTQNIRRTIDITTSSDWSPQQAIPSSSAFYTYVRDKTRFVVFKEPVFIDNLNFEKIKRLNVPTPMETAKLPDEDLYYHPKISTNSSVSDKNKNTCKKQNKIDFSSIDPHKECDENSNYDDFPDKYIGLPFYETHETATFITIVFVFFIIFLIKGPSYLGLTGTFKEIVKFLRSGIWLLIFSVHFYIANPITIVLFFFVALYGMVFGKISERKKNNTNKNDEQQPDLDTEKSEENSK